MPVVAIDFGTTRTGYAISFFGNMDEDLYVQTQWPDQQSPYHKNLSDLIYNPDGRLESWGFSALHALGRLRNDPRRGEYRHLTRYKLQIQDGQLGPAGPEFDVHGTQFRVVEVIGDILAEIRRMVFTDLARAGSEVFNESEIRWCLTVPAIWNELNKQVMQMAAVRAGLISSNPNDADRLEFALEPEAAALYCQKNDTQLDGSQLTPGSRFLVVDAGGGTVDLTAHRVAGRGLREMVPGIGARCGSTYLDGEFVRLLGRLIGDDLLDRIVEEEPAEFLDLMRHWEREKCQYDGGGQEILIPISRRVGRLVDESPTALARLRHAQGGDDENIHLSLIVMADLFRPVVEDVRRTVASMFESLDAAGERCEYLFFVGGFAASPVLERMIRSEFGDRVDKVIVPPQPGKAVVMGAVLYALDQRLIEFRRSRLTYGCRIRAVHDPILDVGRPRIRSEDEMVHRCDGVFDVFVTNGQLLDVDHKVTRIYNPAQADATSITLNILATKSPKVRHADEPGVEIPATLRVEMPDITGGRNREIEVTMFFGRSKVRIRAIDKNSGIEFPTTIDFPRG